MTESFKRIQYARICVEIGVDDVLPECFDIELLDGSCVEIRVEYNWVPKRCVVCKEFGHIAKYCKKFKAKEWRPKEAPSCAPSCAPSRPTSPSVLVDKEGRKEEGWKEVRRHGKTVVVDVSPPPVVSKVQASCSLSNGFQVLQEKEDEDDRDSSLAIVPVPNQGMVDSATLIASSPIQVVHTSQVEVHPTPSSECHSVPISNPLFEKLHMVDELDKKHKDKVKDKVKKGDKRKNGGGGGPGRKNSS